MSGKQNTFFPLRKPKFFLCGTNPCRCVLRHSKIGSIRHHLNFTFVPGDIEFTMTQRPDVIIKYVGGPLYVPPSSDPNYEPIDMQA